MQEESGHNWQMTFPCSEHQPRVPITLVLQLQVLGSRGVVNVSKSAATTCRQVRICCTLASSPLLQAPRKASPAPSLPTILVLCKTETLDFNRISQVIVCSWFVFTPRTLKHKNWCQ